jgi:hypothetical protein
MAGRNRKIWLQNRWCPTVRLGPFSQQPTLEQVKDNFLPVRLVVAS